MHTRSAVACGWLGATLVGGVESGVEQLHALTRGAGCAGPTGLSDLPQQQLGCAVSAVSWQQQTALTEEGVFRTVCNGSRQHQPDGSASTRAQMNARGCAEDLLMPSLFGCRRRMSSTSSSAKNARLRLAAKLRSQGETGHQTSKRAPWPGSLTTSIRPPWSLTMCSTTAKPNPVPRSLVEKKGSNKCALTASDIPVP